MGVSVLLPGFIATRITESDRNRPDHLGERGRGIFGGAPHDGRASSRP